MAWWDCGVRPRGDRYAVVGDVGGVEVAKVTASHRHHAARCHCSYFAADLAGRCVFQGVGNRPGQQRVCAISMKVW